MSELWIRILGLALAGSAGTLARFGLNNLLLNPDTTGFPRGILVVNLLGCLLFGAVARWTEDLSLDPNLRLFVLTGFLGAFTTFSTFAYDFFAMLRTEAYLLAVTQVLTHVIGGLVCVALGYYWGNRLV